MDNRKLVRKHLRSRETFVKHSGLSVNEEPTQHIVILNGGLSNSVTREEILVLFNDYTGSVDVNMPVGKPYCFVSFNEISEAERAKREFHGFSLARSCVASPCIVYTDFITDVPGLERPSSSKPQDLLLFEDYISPEEEELWLNQLSLNEQEEDSKAVMKHRRVKHYGYEFLYSINNVKKDSPLPEGIPNYCKTVLDKICSEFPSIHYPDQLTINQYEPGQGIPPHIDTHSAFEDGIIIISLGSQTVMEFKNPDGVKLPVLLPQRSLTILQKESRYLWSHAIVPRHSDLIPVNGSNAITLVPRRKRISFTFRKVLDPKKICDCNWKDQCDDYKKQENNKILPNTSQEAEKFEKEHVLKVYETISTHFDATRHKQWPKVTEFLAEIQPGSILADIGCGNGKYLGSENLDVFKMGCDTCKNLCSICAEKSIPVFVADALNVPLRDNCVDAVISIAVIHHFATEERRKRAIKEILRILRKKGKALICVWALEQERGNVKSKYLAKNKESTQQAKDLLPVHDNRTKFESQDLFVPWHLRKDGKKSEAVYNRFYHVFKEDRTKKMAAPTCNSADCANQGIKTVELQSASSESSIEADVDSSAITDDATLSKLQPPKVNKKLRQRTTSSSNTANPVVRSGIRTIYTQGRPPWYDSRGQLEQAFMIGICGGSASGKTTVATKIIESLSIQWVSLLSMDSFYKVLTEEQHKDACNNEYNFDHPDAFDFELMIKTLKRLKKGKSIEIPIYNFTTHSREKEKKTLYGANVVIFEGILAFHSKELRDLLDMKVFVDTDADIRLVRRLKRDIGERGRDMTGVMKQYDKFVKPAYNHYIEPMTHVADIIVPRGGENLIAISLIKNHVHSQLLKRGHKFRSELKESAHDDQPLPPKLCQLQKTKQIQSLHTMIRRKDTPRDEFIFYSNRLMRLLVELALSYLPYEKRKIETPQGSVYEGKACKAKKLCGVSILRAGETMEPALTEVCKDIRLGKLLIQTNFETGEPELHYIRLPKDIGEHHVFLLDPTVATGAAAIMAIRILLDHDVPEDQIMLLSLIMAEVGVHSIAYAFPKVKLVTTAVDKEINDRFHIIPGIGNFGDRYFGTDTKPEVDI
ncbi:DgyrCDS345 [Dimorphilus gyrociliatus]|uniref:Uridine kinase n=1 Tax=Dimorphilus gyrociliatus TaxID=2664684 RepID=A0A7I8V483_9ANNE|nr:DgyrCDS345 [Dimorphilus gyrociliatus]